MLYLNREKLRDKITACWIGKNIGGTMGTPFEGKREINDIKGFVTKPGEVLANDDLDLQLIWLMAMDERGPENINAGTLGEYWLSFIDPYWNEYGVGQCNMKEGFFPPLSGELNNKDWKNSNGAWIRTEIWACLYPGRPDKAVQYAFEDASVDHGYGEGTFAALFIAAMESAAFLTSDINVLLKIGLSKIPEDCRIARSVKMVMDAYEKGTGWKETREMLVQDSTDLGWFQAPANIGFTMLGLIYGEGDFKKSMILALNCGDDSDCTGATLGSLMGIMYGQSIIPQDWREHIGDKIVTMSLLQGHNIYPGSCTELTNIIMNLLPVTSKAPFIWNRFEVFYVKPTDSITIYDGENDFSEITMEDLMDHKFTDRMLSRSRYSFKGSSLLADVWIEYDNEPKITANGTLTGKISIDLKQYPEIPDQRHYHLRWFLPEGWRVTGPRNLFVCHANFGKDFEPVEFEIKADDHVEALNRIVLEATTVGRLTPIYLPISIMG